MKPRIAIIGAGLSGMAVAYEARERAERLPGGADVFCFEAGSRGGGRIEAHPVQGFLCERGRRWIDGEDPAVRTLLRRLGLDDARVQAGSGWTQVQVFRNGRLRALPDRLHRWVRGDLVSGPAKWLALPERFAPAVADGVDETLTELATRRLGKRAGTLLADALATALHAGRPDTTSAAAAAPWLVQADARKSLIRALLALRRGDGTTGIPMVSAPPTTLDGGLARLTGALALELGSSLRLNQIVDGVSSMGQRGFRIVLREGPPLDVDAVVLACSARAAARLMKDSDPALVHALDPGPPAPVLQVHLGYRAPAVGRAARLAGFVAPRGEGLRILGCEATSGFLPGRAPEGSVLLTVRLGGAHDPLAVELSDERAIEIARADLRVALGVVSNPYVVHLDRDESGDCPFSIGHLRRWEILTAAMEERPGMSLVGDDLRPDASVDPLTSAPALAERLLEHVAARPIAAAR